MVWLPRKLLMGAQGPARYISNASLYDDDCSSLTGWTKVNGKSGPDTTVQTFDGKTCFRFLTTTAGGTNYTRVYKDVGMFGATRLTVTYQFYFATLGIGSSMSNSFFTFAFTSDTLKQPRIDFASDSIYILNPLITDLGNDPTLGVWLEYTFDFNLATDKVDIYCAPLGGEQTKIVSGQSYAQSSTARPDGTLDIGLLGSITANGCVYVNSIKAGSDLSFAPW